MGHASQRAERSSRGFDPGLSGSPLVLAAARIVVPLVIVLSPELHRAPALAALPPDVRAEQLRFVPHGLALVSRFDLSPSAARVLYVVALSSAATAALGFLSRTSMLVLTLSAGLLFSLSQRGGAVVHDMHLFWIAALLAASPCGDAWSIDAWGEAPLAARGRRYGAPLVCARVMLGLVYLFPGIHKLRDSGLAWASADNVIAHMHAKWLEHGTLPLVRIDHAPLLVTAGALAAVVFELSFLPLALFSRRTRRVALFAGLAFHASTLLFFFIPFPSLWACYVVLLEGEGLERVERRARRLWSALRVRSVPGGGPGQVAAVPAREEQRALGRSEEVGESSRRAPLGALLVSAVVVALACEAGIRGRTQAWPFACYPTFSHVQEPSVPDVVVELVADAPGGSERYVLTGREERARAQHEWAHVWRIAGAYGDPPSEAALRAHARRVALGAGVTLALVRSTRISRASLPSAPERWTERPDAPSVPRVLLMEIAGPP